MKLATVKAEQAVAAALGRAHSHTGDRVRASHTEIEHEHTSQRTGDAEPQRDRHRTRIDEVTASTLASTHAGGLPGVLVAGAHYDPATRGFYVLVYKVVPDAHLPAGTPRLDGLHSLGGLRDAERAMLADCSRGAP